MFLADINKGGGQVVSEGDAKIKGLNAYKVECTGAVFDEESPETRTSFYFTSLHGMAALFMGMSLKTADAGAA